MCKIILVRSPQELVNKGYVGYGWSKVNFSNFSDVISLLDKIKKVYGGYGRRANQVKRFFGLEKDDIVIIPLNKSIAIGRVKGSKTYDKSYVKRENLVSVDFFRDKDNNVFRVSREYLTKKLSSRLRVRMSNISLNEFKEEINQLIDDIENQKNIAIDSRMSDKNMRLEESFKKQLLSNMRAGKIYIKAGGDGLEKLVIELLEIDGYTAKIESKQKYSGKGDIDITAEKTEFHGQIHLAIQVKDYRGETGVNGLNQLKKAFENNEAETTAIPMLITLGEVKNIQNQAENLNIKLMDGEAFVDWLYLNINELSSKTRLSLGISDVPTLLE